MSQVSTAPAPTRPAERIVAIDLLRGFALLGILIMNIQGFAMPAAAYGNPTVYGDLSGTNRWVWTLSHIFADQKFMTIFSLLFGAGILLITEKLDARGQRAWTIHYRRTFWLLIIGLAHAYLLWSGDILVIYALCGFWVYWLRKLRLRPTDDARHSRSRYTCRLGAGNWSHHSEHPAGNGPGVARRLATRPAETVQKEIDRLPQRLGSADGSPRRAKRRISYRWAALLGTLARRRPHAGRDGALPLGRAQRPAFPRFLHRHGRARISPSACLL